MGGGLEASAQGLEAGKAQLPECAQVWDQSSFPRRTGHCSQGALPQPGRGKTAPLWSPRLACFEDSFDSDRLGFKNSALISYVTLDKLFTFVSSLSPFLHLSKEDEGSFIRSRLTKTVHVEPLWRCLAHSRYSARVTPPLIPVEGGI